jgi:hypothetical protein
MLDPVHENFPLKFPPQCSLIRNAQFYPRNPGLNLDPGSTNSSRIAPQERLAPKTGLKHKSVHEFRNKSILPVVCPSVKYRMVGKLSIL